MTTKRNFLLGKGERLISDVVGIRGGQRGADGDLVDGQPLQLLNGAGEAGVDVGDVGGGLEQFALHDVPQGELARLLMMYRKANSRDLMSTARGCSVGPAVTLEPMPMMPSRSHSTAMMTLSPISIRIDSVTPSLRS